MPGSVPVSRFRARPTILTRAVLYCEGLMSEESTRNWTRTYVAVIVIEMLALTGLWWLQRHYGA